MYSLTTDNIESPLPCFSNYFVFQDNYPASAMLKIFLEYSTIQDAAKAERELSGRKFGSAVVACTYFGEKEYSSGQLA